MHGRRINQSTWVFAFRLLRQEADVRSKTLLSAALLLVLSTSALTALSPVFLKLIVDHVTTANVAGGMYLTTGLLVAAYAGSQWLAKVLGELRAMTAGQADQRLHRRLSMRLFTHVMALPLRFHLDRKTGAISQTLANGLVGYRLLLQHVVQTVLPVIVELAMISAVLLVLDKPALFGIIGASLVCYTIAFSAGAVTLTKPARAVSAAHIDANALLTDSIINYETVKSFCAEPRLHQRMDHAFAQTESHWARFFSRKALNGILVGTIFAVSLGASVYVSAMQVQRNRMSLGDLVLVNTYMLQIFRPMELLGFAFRDIAQGVAFIEKMLELFRQQVEPVKHLEGNPLPPGPGELIFDRVFFSYNRGRSVLRDVSFRVPAGKSVALVGVSGSGKSSLIRLLMRFYEPSSGRILLDGKPISEASVSSVRATVAVVPQDTILFNDTIANNIAFGNPDSSAKDVVEAARIACIHDFIVAQPRRYETRVGERGLRLSGGEKQRIAIARAILKNPRIFVFDEATCSLDSTTEEQILSNLSNLSRGTTTLAIAHRLSTIVDADEILVLDHGKIAEHGKHRDLLRHCGVYAGMWNAQQHGPESRYGTAV